MDEGPPISTSLSATQREELLRRSWMATDGLWFYHTASAQGLEQANKTNALVVREFGRQEMRRLMRALGVSKVETIEQYRLLYRAGVELFLGSLFEAEEYVEGDVHHIDVTTCFAYKGARRAGIGDVYRCGPGERLTGWLDAMRLPATIEPGVGLCQMAHTGSCATRSALLHPALPEALRGPRTEPPIATMAAGTLTMPTVSRNPTVEPLGELQPGVGLWRASLDRGAEVPRFFALLSGEERARAAELRDERDHRRFVVGRGILRELLADVVAADPEALRFDVYPGTTKPRLAWPPVPVSFNLSHSADEALYGVTTSEAVAGIGVDVEQVRAEVDVDGMAARYFSTREQDSLGRIADRRARLTAFFACWTCKEAVLKGIGVGLHLALDTFDVGVPCLRPSSVTGRGAAAGLMDRWVVHPLVLGPGLVAGVALQGVPGDSVDADGSPPGG